MSANATQVPVIKAALLLGATGFALYEANQVVNIPWYVWLGAAAAGGVIMYAAMYKSGAY